jgi:hypothetical protein
MAATLRGAANAAPKIAPCNFLLFALIPLSADAISGRVALGIGTPTQTWRSPSGSGDLPPSIKQSFAHLRFLVDTHGG